MPGGTTALLDGQTPDPMQSVGAYFKEGFAGNSIVLACVNILAEAVLSLKLEVHQLDANGNKRVISDHQLQELLR